MTTKQMQQDNQSAGQGITRREFLVRTAAGGGLMVGCMLPGAGLRGGEARAASYANVTAWIVIGSDETVQVLVPITEMGQGTSTGLAQVVADELRITLARVSVAHAPVDAAHGGTNASPWGRFTGGSTGMRLFSPGLRQAAANAREMLIQAAARYWGLSATTGCVAAGGSVTYNGKSLTYGFLAPLVTGYNISVTNAQTGLQTNLVGTSPPRLDLPAKVTGAARFGIDTWMPGMVFAAVKHCPTIGGTVASVGSTPSGMLKVVKVGRSSPTGLDTGVAVIAATTWDAMRGARSVSVAWDTTAANASNNDTAAIDARAATLMGTTTPTWSTSVNAQNLPVGMASPNRAINATYQLPFLAHATMEPLNCTARFTPAMTSAPARCEVWAPTQAPDFAAQTAQAFCPANTVVTVVNTLVGCGFGRKFEMDFVREAVQVALAYPGVPVKLTWPREQDFTYDQFRPMSLSRIQAAASASTGRLTAWSNRIVTPSINVQRGGDPNALDTSAVDGAVTIPYATELPYAPDPMLVEYVRHDTTIPVGYWRSVGLSINTFAVESAMDELAGAIGWDPIEFRLANLAPASRMYNVLTALKTFSGWTAPVASGHARGVAIAAGFGSFMGQVAEISVTRSSTGAVTGVTVHKVSMVIDCGTAVHPDAIKAQIEGAVAQAVAATLYVRQTFVNGVPQVTNFNQYRMLRLQDMPQVAVQIIANGDPMGGVGEPGVPCVAPAIANAYAKLVGGTNRKRSLPFFPGATLGGL